MFVPLTAMAVALPFRKFCPFPTTVQLAPSHRTIRLSLVPLMAKAPPAYRPPASAASTLAAGNTPVSTIDHWLPSHLEKTIGPSFVNLPPAYSAPPYTANGALASIKPIPTGAHALPSHFAM